MEKLTKFNRIEGFPDELKGRINSFITTQFDDSLTVEGQLRVLIKWIKKNIALTNEMVDYLNKFEEEFDNKLYKTVFEIVEDMTEKGLIDNKIEEEIRKFLNSFTYYDRVENYVRATTLGLQREIPPYYVDRLNQMAEHLNVEEKENTLRMIFLTDNHNQYTEYAHNSLFHYEYASILTHLAKIDGYVLGGDNANGWYDKPMILNELIAAMAIPYNYSHLNTDVFALNGNHDNGAYQNGKTKYSQIISNEQLKDIFRTRVSVFNEVRNGDSLYCYKDYADKKYRVFFLNNFDFHTEETNPDGTLKWNNLNEGGYGETQLKWFAQALKETPADYHVIIFQHAPMLDIFNDQTQYNGDVLKGILKAYKNGEFYRVIEPNRPKPVELEIDYTGRQGVIACVVNGHLHQDRSTTWEGILCISTGGSICYPQTDDRKWDTYSEDLWDCMIFDHDNQEIRCLRFGWGNNRTFKYGGAEV